MWVHGEKKSLIVILIFLFNILCLNLSSPIEAAGSDPYGPKKQEVSNTIESLERVANPGVYWYQLDNGSFRADHTNGPTYSDNLNSNSCSRPFPAEKEIPNEVDFSRWPAEHWPEFQSQRITQRMVENIRIKSVDYQTSNKQLFYTGVGTTVIREGSTIVKIITKTGGSHQVTEWDDYENGGRTNQGCLKQVVAYHTPMDIIWKGDLVEEKEIDVTPDSVLTIGQTKQMKAEVSTRHYGETDFNEGIDVSRREAEIKWFSSDETIASIELKTGMLTAESPGTVTVRAIWNNGTYLISDTATITVTSEPGLVVNLPNACKANTTPLQAEAVLTKPDRSVHKLTAHPKLTWQSSNPAVATIGADGKITTKGIVGSTTISAHFLDSAQQLDEQGTQVLEVKDCTDDGEGGNDGDPGVTLLTLAL